MAGTNSIVHVAFYFGLFGGFEVRQPHASRLLDKFRHADDRTRDAIFKIIPSIADGPLVLKFTVPTRPAISGKSVRQVSVMRPRHHTRPRPPHRP